MPPEVLFPSPFIAIGTEEFETPSGIRVVPVYRSSDAALVLVSPAIACLLSGTAIAVDAINGELRRRLSQARLICADQEEERQHYYRKITEAAKSGANRTFVLLPTSYCNMACDYCGQQHTKQVLVGSHRNTILRRIQNAINESGTKSISIRWFGGEPLMAFAAIRQMSQIIIEAADAARKDYESNITTNGALLDKRKLRVLVEECRVSTFHITLDGPAEIHDMHRPLKSGKKTFERLTSFLAEAVASPENRSIRFVLRTNVDVRNSEYVSEYLHAMASCGFARRPNVLFSLVAVHPWSNDVSALELSKKEFASREAAWINEMSDLGLNFQLLPTDIKPLACGAVTRAAEVTSTSGRIFSCTEQPLVLWHEKHSALADSAKLAADQLRPVGEFDDWDQSVAQKKVPCGTCWMLPVCGGHCPKAWHEGDIPCPSMKLNIAVRLSLACRRRGLRPVGQFKGFRPE